MINLSIQNFILFIVLPLIPSRFRRIKEKGGLKLSRTLQGLPRYKSLSVAPVSVTEQDPMGPSWDRLSPISSALAPL